MLPVSKNALFFAVATVATSCQLNSFSGSGGGQKPATEVKLVNLVQIRLECQTTTGVTPMERKDQTLILSSQEVFTLKKSELAKDAKIQFVGNVCPGQQAKPRDIVFVVDVSGSMRSNDPATNDTCARREAVQKVVDAVGANGQNRFAAVLFSSSVYYSSSSFVTDLNSLHAGMNGAASLCYNAGSTNYQAAITGAAALLSAGNAGSSKEIYFVSDGAPDPGRKGIEEATQVKSSGVTIATVMIGPDNDSVLKQIASVDSTGQPLHRQLSTASDLAKSLSDISQSLKKSSTITWKQSTKANADTINLQTASSGNTYTSELFTFENLQGLSTLDATLQTTDANGQPLSKKVTLKFE